MLDGTAAATTLSGLLLRGGGDLDRTALISGDQVLTFGDLRERVARQVCEIEFPERSVVALSGDHSVEYVVSYLALLEAGHVPLVAGDHVDRLAEQWAVGGVVTATSAGVDVTVTGSTELAVHPDLALLASTSGSTGSPKLVRLSHRNLSSNALSIAEYQRIDDSDRGITSLPLHYCFGLSVLHSHLAVGAGVVLTDASVVDRCFRSALRDHRVTNLAGVPHTYEMLDRSNPDELADTSLRLFTQAGGRMTSTAVERWVGRAERWGAEFMVMYGQSEATARIAYLPPELARRRPGAVGRPIPGGSIELRPVDGQPADVGEIVYRGPNVMMGYARGLDDLALGHGLDALPTGDLARYVAADEVYEIVGRTTRFVKPFGLRIDLDEVESQLAEFVDGEIAVAGDDDRLVVHAPGADPAELCRLLTRRTGLPEHVLLVRDRPVPRTESGKVDQKAMLVAADAPRQDSGVRETGTRSNDSVESVTSVFTSVFGRNDIRPDDTFVSLGGDSLSYVECSIRLEAALGRLPADWHLESVGSLADAIAPRRGLARLDTTVVLRAVGICLVVSTHMRVRHLPGGAHMLLAVAGFNLARFMAPLDSPVDRIRAGLRTAGRAAVPTFLWVGTGMLLFGSYGVGTLLLVNNYVGPASHDGDHWHFWFIEVFVHLVVLASLLSAVPFVRRLDRRFAYLLPLSVLIVTSVVRMEWADMGDWYNLRFRTHGVAFFFVLGWLIQRSTTWQLRAVTSAVTAASVLGYFHVAQREWRIVALLLLLVWVRELPVPRRSVRVIGTIAAASMWIYVSHFAIWPLYRSVFVREFAYVLTIASGVVVWFVAERLLTLLNTWRQAGSHHPTFPRFVPRQILRGTP